MNKTLLDVLRQKGKVSAERFGKKLDFDMEKIAPKQTEIFVLSPEVALAAEKLVRSKVFKMPDITQLKFPYPFMAIEIPFTDEIRKLRAGVAEGMFPIERVGIYIASNHEHGWINCSTYWGYENPAFIEPPLYSFSLGVDDLPAPSVGVATPQNPQDAVYFKMLPSLCIVDAFQRHKVPPDRLDGIFTNPTAGVAIRESVTELPLLLFACTLMLNCKTGVKRTTVAAQTPPAGQKLGEKKKKQYTARRYTVLHLEEIETVGIDGTISRRTDVAAHYVRGHFKQRHSGIYWWNPFVRGKGTPRKREAYVVKTTELAEA
jgi:hypothetical protein